MIRVRWAAAATAAVVAPALVVLAAGTAEAGKTAKGKTPRPAATATATPTATATATATATGTATTTVTPTATASTTTATPTGTASTTATPTGTATATTTETATAAAAPTATATATSEPAATATSDAASTISTASSCPAVATRLVPVSTAAGLASALAGARPGDVIQLADGTYTGTFVDAVAGTAAAHVVICGSSAAVIDGGDHTVGYALYLKRAPYTEVRGITLTNAQKGIMLDWSSNSVIDGVTVHDVGDEGIHLRRMTSDSVVADSRIFNTGLLQAAYGEGVYVGSADTNWCTYTACDPDTSDRNVIVGNSIGPNVPAEDVDIKPGTTGGVVRGNSFDGTGMTYAQSWVDVKGNGWLIAGNTGRYPRHHGFTVSQAVSGWGNDTTFTGNIAYVYGSGFGIKLLSPYVTGTVVYADNVAIQAASGLTNIAVTPVP
ncbi:MAG TPA: right-handed parallel beta-helix repeat-containing protein [Mycobacteriales bacterium]|nr:right-handed parallel beta-helix repeat-containing protein [Mycobacteriales bacterium]